MAKTTVSYKWSDRKRIIFGLPWTFTKYAATDEKLLIRTGVLNVKEEEVRLYRILDLTLKGHCSSDYGGSERSMSAQRINLHRNLIF